MKNNAMLIFAAVIFLTGGASPSVRAVDLIPNDKQFAISLNGAWRFKLEQAPPPPKFLGVSGKPIPIIRPEVLERFETRDYREDSNWHDISVPGNWEMAGYSPATYDQPDNASAMYRLQFKVPAHWKGRVVKVNFDGVQNGCEIWCNGRPVAADESSWGITNYHESGWTAWQADLTPAIQFGQSNLLALRVVKNTRSVDCDTGDYFSLGGVYRPLTLFSVPPTHIQDFDIHSKVLTNGADEVTVSVKLNQPEAGSKISVHLKGESKTQSEPDAGGKVTFTQMVRQPKLWSAEFPNLYPLVIELKNAKGEVTEHLTRNVGLREVATRDGMFYVNNVPVKLVGICRHDLYPTVGTAITPEIWKKDLTLMKAANFNAIRTSHYPYGSGFYDLCDQMGFYVLDEEPFCWVDCQNTNLLPAFEQRCRETVVRDKNHPSVVIWGIGNENNIGPDNIRAAQLTREMDPERPRLISTMRTDSNGISVEFDDKHYITPKGIHEAEQNPRRAKWPMLYSENPNVWEVRNGPDYGSLDLWGAVIDRTWKELWQDDHVTGTFLFEWQDRGVADKCPTKYYNYFPNTGVNLIKVKGIVDGFRNPRPEYYHCKMAQAPIVIGREAEIAPGGVLLQVTNHYSFTDLGGLRVGWTLTREGREIGIGKATLPLAPRSHGAVSLKLPASKLSEADTLRLDINHPGGWNIETCQFFLKPIAHPPPDVQTSQGLMFPKFNLLTGTIKKDAKLWKIWERSWGELTNLQVGLAGKSAEPMDAAMLLATPIAQVQSLDADVMLPTRKTAAGRLHADLADGKMNYTFKWNGAKTDVYELGWVFTMPPGVDHFSWDRKANWTWYPPYHIGRQSGTATPDSMKAELTRLDRPDAFDFNSTKFDCNWASLTGTNGRGLCVVFSPEQRQHVRGGMAADGRCTLVVNRCYSPPRDISSTLVEDFYTVLKKNETVNGSFQINGFAK